MANWNEIVEFIKQENKKFLNVFIDRKCKLIKKNNLTIYLFTYE